MITVEKIDLHRRLCIKKDLNELFYWHNTLETFNTELDHLTIIEKQLIKNASILNTIMALRRKNVMLMASFCKYEQELIRELEFGKTEYNANRLKIHEQKRDSYILLVNSFMEFKNVFYLLLRKFKQK